MYKNILFIFLMNILIKIRTERWWPPAIEYNIENHKDGYAGTSNEPAIDFYLCGERKYKVHYLGDPPLLWSQNFSNCDPAGNGRIIDGICVYGNKSYRGRLHVGSWWLGVIKGCNISDSRDGFSGRLGNAYSCISINGGDSYRISSLPTGYDIKSSHPKNSSDRIIKHIFGKNVKNFANYDKEYELDLSTEKNNKFHFFKSNIILINNTNLNLDGEGIKLIFLNEKIVNSFWGEKEINKNFIEKLKNIINFDINEERKNFEEIIAKEIMNGILVIHTFYKEKRIQVDIGIRICSDAEGFRGGIKFNLILINNLEFINIIKKVIELISRYIYQKKNILDKLKSFNDIEQLEEIIQLISPFDIMLNQIIFLYLLNK